MLAPGSTIALAWINRANDITGVAAAGFGWSIVRQTHEPACRLARCRVSGPAVVRTRARRCAAPQDLGLRAASGADARAGAGARERPRAALSRRRLDRRLALRALPARDVRGRGGRNARQ